MLYNGSEMLTRHPTSMWTPASAEQYTIWMGHTLFHLYVSLCLWFLILPLLLESYTFNTLPTSWPFN